MAARHWMEDFEKLESSRLLPSDVPLELLISVARSLAQYRDGSLDETDASGTWELLKVWIGRILLAQDASRYAIFKKHSDHLLAGLAEELELWVQQELITRQVGHPTYEVKLGTIFVDQFDSLLAQLRETTRGY